METNNKNKWDSLTLKEKSEIMKMAISSGVNDLKDIKNTYNLFYDGGDTEKQDRSSNSAANAVTEVVLNAASEIINSGLISDETKERLVEFAMRLSGGNSSMGEAQNILSFMATSDGIKALAKVVFTDESVGSIVQKSLDSSQSPLVGNYSGFALPSDIIDPDALSFLEEHPKDADFVSSYITGKTPFVSAGVRRVPASDKTRYGRYEQYINENYKGRDVQTYQGHRDTLPNDLVQELNQKSSKKETKTFGVHDTEVPFPFGEYKNDKETRGYYDAAGYNLELVEGSDGKTYGRISDMYDFLPRDYVRQYNKEGSKGLSNIISSVDKVGYPFIFRSPWFDASQFDIPEHILENYNENKKEGNKYYTGGPTEEPVNIHGLQEIPYQANNSTLPQTEETNYQGDILGIPVPQGVETVASFVPILGTLMDAKEFIGDPSWENAGYLGLSIASELPFLKGLKAAKAAKAAEVVNKYEDAVKVYNKAADKVRKMESTPNLNYKKIKQARQDLYKAYSDMHKLDPEFSGPVHEALNVVNNLGYFQKAGNIYLLGADAVANYAQQIEE